MSRIVIAGSSAYDVDASSASRLLPSPTRPPRVDPADLTHLCAGITIGGGTATSGSAPGDEIGSASAPGGNANGPVGVGVGEGEGLASILATAGTICFDARLGAGDLNPNGGATRAGLAACGVVAFALAGFCNGMLISALRDRTQQAINIVRGNDTGVTLYGQQGNAHLDGGSRVLGTA